jgi:hypothetical protein
MMKASNVARVMLLIVIVMTLMFVYFGCKKAPINSTNTSDSSWTKVEEKSKVIPEQKVSKEINYDSLRLVFADMIAKGKKPEIIYVNGETRLVIKEVGGKIVADCIKDEQLIKYLVTEMNRLKTSYTVKVAKVIPDWAKYAIGGLAALTVGLVLIIGLLILFRK